MRGAPLSVRFFQALLVLLATCLASPSFAATVKVGVALPLSGDSAADGKAMQIALDLFQRDVRGTLGDNDIEFVVRDDKNDPTAAAAVAAEFAKMGVAAVIGHPDGKVAGKVAKAYQGAGIPFVSSYSSNPRATKVGDHVYSVNYNFPAQGERIAAYLAGVLEAESILLIVSEEGDGKDLLRSINNRSKRVGVEIAHTIKYEEGKVGDSFLKDALQEFMGGGKGKGNARPERPPRGRGGAGQRPGRPGQGGGKKGEREQPNYPFQAIVVIGGAESGAKIVNQIAKMKMNLPIFGTDSWATSAFTSLLQSNRVQLLVTSNFSDQIVTVGAHEFMNRYMAAAGTDSAPVPTLFTYDAAALVAAAVRDGATDAAAVQASLARRSSADEAVSGLSGLLYFDKDGALKRQPLFLMWQKGVLKPALTQLREVNDARILRDVRAGKLDSERIKDRRVVVAGGVPYFKTAVVYAGIDFYRVNQVDIAGQKFDIELFTWFHFQGDVDVQNIAFLNSINEETSTNEVLRQDVGIGIQYVCYKIKGTYLTPYDLRKFPFDTQSLPLKMAHRTRDSNEIILVVDNKNLSNFPVSDIYPEEWTYGGRADYSASFIPATTFGDPMYMGLGSRSAFSVYEANVIVKRILFPYLITLFLPLGIMIVISLFVFLIKRDQFDARLTLTMTALLSILVFHLAQGESLPSVGYLMKADQYFIATYILMFSLISEVILVNVLDDRIADNKLIWVERIFAVFFVVFSLAVYLLLTIAAFV